MLVAESLGSQVHLWSQTARDRAWLWVPFFGKSQAQLEVSWTESVFPRSQCLRPGLEPQARFLRPRGQPHLSPASSGGQLGSGLCRPLRTAGSHPRPRPCPDCSRWVSSVFSRLCRVKPQRPDRCQAHCPGLHQRRATRPLASSDPKTLQRLAVQNRVMALLWPDASGQPCPVRRPTRPGVPGSPALEVAGPGDRPRRGKQAS